MKLMILVRNEMHVSERWKLMEEVIQTSPLIFKEKKDAQLARQLAPPPRHYHLCVLGQFLYGGRPG